MAFGTSFKRQLSIRRKQIEHKTTTEAQPAPEHTLVLPDVETVELETAKAEIAEQSQALEKHEKAIQTGRRPRAQRAPRG